MEGQSNFGIQSSSIINSELEDLIFGGGSPAASAEAIKPLDIKKIENEEESEEDKSEKIELSADELLDGLEEQEAEKENKPVVKKENKKEDVQDEEIIENTEDDTFTLLSKNLVDLGIFNHNEDEELPKTAEEFKDKWIAERQNQVNDDIYNFLISKHGEEGYQVFEDIFMKGVSPKEYLSKYSEIVDFKNLDLSVEANQEKIMRQSLKNQGFKDELIDKKIQKLKDYGDLEEEASIAHEFIIRNQESELQEEAKRKEHQEQLRNQQKLEYQNKLQTLLAEKVKARDFDGIPVTDKVAREMLDYMDTEKWQLASGEKLTDLDKDILEMRDPKNMELRLKFALLMKNKLDLSKIKTNLVSKESSKYFNDLVIKDKSIKRKVSTPMSGDFFSGLNA